MIDLSKIPENLIDLDDGLSRVGGDEEFFIELLKDLAELGQDSLIKFKEAVDSSDGELLRITAHSLKGASGNLGAKELQNLAFELEQCGREKNFDNSTALINKIENEITRLINFINS